MKHEVYRTFPLGNGRNGIEKMRKFLWFISWKPIPDIYVELDQLVEEEKKLQMQLKNVSVMKKQADQHIKEWIQFANNSYQEYSRALSPKMLRRTRIDTSYFNNQVIAEPTTGKHTHKTGPPGSFTVGPADSAPPRQNGGNNQQNNGKK